ncbi:hypothetical protein [Thiocapsa rosea]|uniref:Uncharacterized protein n=1 Tax=Thiocapsa rosea TaxID=69360 RepID=A0A495VAV5_9GAMM|nr:hypothetical protein [Thiocapsa rosea]RKT45880.1 hypothetical protein BDD21_3364 [Thiocapsa rosea]
MKSKLLILIATLIASPVVMSDTNPLALDLDRSVAHDRTFATQAGHDWYEQQRRITAELEAEHLLAKLHEGVVTRNGEFDSIEFAQIANALVDPRVMDLLETSAYYEAVFQGRVAILN